MGIIDKIKLHGSFYMSRQSHLHHLTNTAVYWWLCFGLLTEFVEFVSHLSELMGHNFHLFAACNPFNLPKHQGLHLTNRIWCHTSREMMKSVCTRALVRNDYRLFAPYPSFSAANNKRCFIQMACFGHNSHTFLHLCCFQIAKTKNRTREREQL